MRLLIVQTFLRMGLDGLVCQMSEILSLTYKIVCLFLSYVLNAASEGTTGLASNPEVRGSASASAVAAAGVQAEALRLLTARLKDAYNGVEVQWLDTDARGTLYIYLSSQL